MSSTRSTPVLSARRSLACGLLAAILASPAAAQVKAFSHSGQCEVTSVIYYTQPQGGGFSFKGFASISYTAPEWKEEYAGMVQQKNKRYRLGSEGWTTLDTNVAFESGGKSIPAGNYYVVLEVSDQPGVCNLVLLDAAKIRGEKLLPNASDQTKGGIAIPLKNEKPVDDENVAKLRITLSADEKDATKTTLELRWGNLKMVAPLTAKVEATN